MLPFGSTEDKMLRSRTISYLLAAALGAGVVMTVAADADAKGKKAKVAKKKAKPPAKLTAEQKKAREELMGPFKWGMTKDEVIGALSKQLDERYAELIKETQDVYKQDQLRKEKGKEIKRVKKSYVAFEGQKTGWDVSIIDEQFKQGVEESMLEYWENQGGKNQRRFFFFQGGELYKMFIQIDTTQFDPEQQTYEFFSGLMKAKFGGDAVDANASYAKAPNGSVFVKAMDKTRFYDAFVLVVLDPGRAKNVDAIRKERIQDVKEENSIVNAIKDDGSSTPSLDDNKDAVQGVIGDKKKAD
jgi:hypothetical protein